MSAFAVAFGVTANMTRWARKRRSLEHGQTIFVLLLFVGLVSFFLQGACAGLSKVELHSLIFKRGTLAGAEVMVAESPTVAHVSQVIHDVTAPAFLLGAIAGFIALLISRMNRVIDRSQALNAIGDKDDVKGHLKSDIPRLERRAVLLNRAIFYSTISAIVASFLVIVSFVSAYLNVQHEYGVGLFFIISIGFFITSLINLALETRIALLEYDHFGGK